MIETIARFFSTGGAFMWIILAIFASALAVIIERLIFYLHTCRNDSTQMVADVAKALNADQPDQALAHVTTNTAPLNVILGTAISRWREGFTYPQIRQGVEEVAISEVPRLSQRVNYLAMFANVATLTGLLGTIFGLQQSFSSLAAAEASQKAALLAAGISQAMNTTAFGLIVAIPCMIAFSKLSNMQTRLVEEVDSSSVKILNYLAGRMS